MTLPDWWLYGRLCVRPPYCGRSERMRGRRLDNVWGSFMDNAVTSSARDASARGALTRFVDLELRRRQIVSTPATRRVALRRLVASGIRGAMLGLHEIPGIMRVRLYEPGDSAYDMQPGCIIVACWGGDPEAIYRACEDMRPAGVVAVPIVWPPTLGARLEHWIAWTIARFLCRRWLRR